MPDLKLNSLKPAAGSRRPRRRVGRGNGSGFGKTCGRGHKGQRSRSGGKPRVGFEGGQMPLQRRLPKVGFRSPRAGLTAEVRLRELAQIEDAVIDAAALRKAKLVPASAKRIKVILSGEITKPVTLKGLAVTAGAAKAIESAGGKIEIEQGGAG